MMYWFSFVDKKEKTICNRHGDWIVPKNPALVSAKDVALSGWTQYNFLCSADSKDYLLTEAVASA